jgi:hypothetical protein
MPLFMTGKRSKQTKPDSIFAQTFRALERGIFPSASKRKNASTDDVNEEPPAKRAFKPSDNSSETQGEDMNSLLKQLHSNMKHKQDLMKKQLENDYKRVTPCSALTRRNSKNSSSNIRKNLKPRVLRTKKPSSYTTRLFRNRWALK